MITVTNLYKSFPMGEHTLPVLKGIDLTIARGELIAVIGASGAGKSTMLHILGLLDRPTSGTVSFEGQDLFQLPEAAQAEFRNKRIGFVFQFHHLLPEFTALENACMPALIQRRQPDDVRAEATAILNDVGLGARLHHKPGELSRRATAGRSGAGASAKARSSAGGRADRKFGYAYRRGPVLPDA